MLSAYSAARVFSILAGQPRRQSRRKYTGGSFVVVRRGQVSYRLVHGLDKVGTSFYFCEETSGSRNIIWSHVDFCIQVFVG